MLPLLTRLPPAEWTGLAGLIHACNRRADGGVHCLHAAQGEDVAAHTSELAALAPDEAVFWAVMQGNERVGLIGCTFDTALGRAWVRGPLVTDPDLLRPLQTMAGPALQAALPHVGQFDAFPTADDPWLNDWYAAAGYTALQVHRVLQAPTATATATASGAGPGPVRRAAEPDLPAVLTLHDSLFPAAYLGEADFRKALGAADRALFVAAGVDGAPVGYLHVQDDPHAPGAYVDYLGVAPPQQGRGCGRALLEAARLWGAQQGRARISLTVREDRGSALSLYGRAGFVEVSAGRHWRRQVHKGA